MALTDILIVMGVFAAFGLLILAKLKEKSPKKHAALMGYFKSTGKIKDKLIKGKTEGPTPIVLPDSARIM